MRWKRKILEKEKFSIKTLLNQIEKVRRAVWKMGRTYLQFGMDDLRRKMEKRSP